MLISGLAPAHEGVTITSTPRKNHISTGPQSVLSLAASFEYERVIARHVTVFAGAEGSVILKGVTGSIGARYYFTEALSGAFVDAHLMATTAAFDGERYRALGGGVLGGYAWQLPGGFEMSIGGGADVIDFQGRQSWSMPTNFSLPFVVAAAFDGGIIYSTPRTMGSGVRFAPSLRATIGYAF